jgi:hypothetical protein
MRQYEKKPKVFRSLANYKSMHSGTAKSKGVEKELADAKTLTAARRILFGSGGRAK